MDINPSIPPSMNNNSIVIRPAKRLDTKAIYDLICELAEFEKARDQVSISMEELQEDGFGSDPAYRCIVAEKNHEIVGFALYYIRYSTWKGKCVYLEDFLVKKEFRRCGIGRRLFEQMLVISKKLNVRLMTWQVLDWNKSAIDFYDQFGAKYDAEWLNGKIYFNPKS